MIDILQRPFIHSLDLGLYSTWYWLYYSTYISNQANSTRHWLYFLTQ